MLLQFVTKGLLLFNSNPSLGVDMKRLSKRQHAINTVVAKMNQMIDLGYTRHDCIDALKQAQYKEDTIIFLLDLIKADK